MKRKDFIRTTGLAGAGMISGGVSLAHNHKSDFPVVRTPEGERRFRSKVVDQAIRTFQANVKNKELVWLFNNCFPNTLDTTVFYSEKNNKPETYVITGDIDAMWLRDSSAQVFPYVQFARNDKPLQNLLKGVINKQAKFILLDPYANAFYDDPDKSSKWVKDFTEMKPGVHERKWELDSLCYPVRLAFAYWKSTGDNSPFDAEWKSAVEKILATFKEQQRKVNDGPYKFQRETANANSSVQMYGYGYPVKPVGLIASIFRPSDDVTIFPFLVPSNFFAVTILRQASEMVNTIYRDSALAGQLHSLANEVEAALKKYAVVLHPRYGKIYAFEINGYDSHLLMDDANVPSLLGMPYLKSINRADPVYMNTRRFVWSFDNPFFYQGKAAEGIGGPHLGKNMIWPMSIIMKAFTSLDDKELKWCIHTLRSSHAGTGFMHEAFAKDDPKKFTRKWFAWANTLFGELLWKVMLEKPYLLT